MKKIVKKSVFLLTMILFSVKGIYSQTTTEDIVHLSRIDEGLKAPVRMAIDQQDNVYVTDANNKLILKFDASGNLLEEMNTGVEPLSLAINHNNQVFFGDGKSGIIYRLETDGSKTAFYSETKYPNSMVFDADGLLYVVDSYLNRVIVLDLSANVVRNIGEGTFLFPTGIAYNRNNDRILVAEHGGLGTGFSPTVKVWMFDLDGALVGSFGRHGSEDGQFYRIQGITVGMCGNIYVSDPYQGQISIFDKDGIFITKFGEFGSTEGQLNVPLDIVSTSQNKLLVSSLNNSAFDVYGINSTLPSARMNNLNTIICQGESTDIEIEFTGTAPWTFTYSMDGLNPVEVNNISESPYILTVSEPGIYELTALSDANAEGTCFTGKTRVDVNSDSPTCNMPGGEVSICAGESIDVIVDFTGISPWTFSYTKDGLDPKTITTTNNPYILSVSEAGLYEVVALEGGGCTGSNFTGGAQITINPLPTSTITVGNETVPICLGETAELTLELTGSSPWSFTYTVDDTSPIAINGVVESPYILLVSEQGTYEVKLISDQNCSNTKSVGYPDVVYMPSAEIASTEATICEGETTPIEINFTGTPPWSFTYQVNASITETITKTYSNPYTLNASYHGFYELIELSDVYYSSSCYSGSAMVNVDPLPIAGFTYNINSLEVNFLDASDNADSYLWDFGDGSSSIESSPVHLYSASGNYTISLTITNDKCGENSKSETIALTETPVEEIDPDDVVKIYPNPSNGLVTLEIDNPVQSGIRIDIISTQGIVVYSNIFYSQNIIEQIDLRSLKKGMYVVKIYSKDFFDIRKLILNNSKKRFYSGK